MTGLPVSAANVGTGRRRPDLTEKTRLRRRELLAEAPAEQRQEELAGEEAQAAIGDP